MVRFVYPQVNSKLYLINQEDLCLKRGLCLPVEVQQDTLLLYQIVHLCGKGNLDKTLLGYTGYKQFEYIHDELPNILAATDVVITRGGSNAIFEFLALKIPMLIIPLSKKQSRGD